LAGLTSNCLGWLCRPTQHVARRVPAHVRRPDLTYVTDNFAVKVCEANRIKTASSVDASTHMEADIAVRRSPFCAPSPACFERPITSLLSVCLGRANACLLTTRPELMAALIRPWLGSIQVIHGWK
jgi:DNA-binding transcriptional LysR family regulator